MKSQVNSVIHLSNVRLSFPNISEPSKYLLETTGKTTYCCDFILSPEHPALKEIKEVYAELALEKWEKDAPAVMKLIDKEKKFRFFGPGDEKVNTTTFAIHPGYENNVYVSAKKDDVRPQIADEEGKAIDPLNTMLYQEYAKKFYGGCYVNAVIKIWLQNNNFGRAVRSELVGLQFLKDGEPFGESALDVSTIFSKVNNDSFSANVPSFLK